MKPATTGVSLALCAAVGTAVLFPLFTPGNAVSNSLPELNHIVVRQTTRFTCGPAALSTLMRYQFGLELDEITVASALLKGRSWVSIEAQGGFSLLDLFDFARTLGFEPRAERDLSLAFLSANLPAIVPVTLKEDALHFLVVIEHRGDRFAVVDPAVGGRLIPEKEFQEIWPGVALTLNKF